MPLPAVLTPGPRIIREARRVPAVRSACESVGVEVLDAPVARARQAGDGLSDLVGAITEDSQLLARPFPAAQRVPDPDGVAQDRFQGGRVENQQVRIAPKAEDNPFHEARRDGAHVAQRPRVMTMSGARLSSPSASSA
jgi:hypothetical protein